MTDNIETGGPAFPGSGPSHPQPSGMTLRDYFACKALPVVYDDWATALEKEGEIIDMEDVRNLIAQDAYLFADAMMEARK